jgi:hypothetical protein
MNQAQRRAGLAEETGFRSDADQYEKNTAVGAWKITLRQEQYLP